jgi:CMP-N-acetylneuraminic acid synthetase
MRNQIQRLPLKNLIRIAGRGLMAFAAREFSEIATIGMVVIVYDSDPPAETNATEPE